MWFTRLDGWLMLVLIVIIIVAILTMNWMKYCNEFVSCHSKEFRNPGFALPWCSPPGAQSGVLGYESSDAREVGVFISDNSVKVLFRGKMETLKIIQELCINMLLILKIYSLQPAFPTVRREVTLRSDAGESSGTAELVRCLGGPEIMLRFHGDSATPKPRIWGSQRAVGVPKLGRIVGQQVSENHVEVE